MAARRERERRRPAGDRRYRFAAPETAVDSDETLIGDGEAIDEIESPPAPRQTAVATPQASSSRGGTKTAARPFSAYKEEYAYVGRDLRRVGLVIGSLLIVLIALYFVLPLLIH